MDGASHRPASRRALHRRTAAPLCTLARLKRLGGKRLAIVAALEACAVGCIATAHIFGSLAGTVLAIVGALGLLTAPAWRPPVALAVVSASLLIALLGGFAPFGRMGILLALGAFPWLALAAFDEFAYVEPLESDPADGGGDRLPTDDHL